MSTGSASGAEPGTSDPLVDLARFLSVPPPPPAEIQVIDAVRREPVTAGRVAGAVVDELAWQIIGGADDGDAPAPRCVRVKWTSAGTELARFEMASGYVDAVRAAILAARTLRIPVFCSREVNRVFGDDLFARYFAGSPLPEMGPLWRIVGVEDSPERFDAMLGEADRPGRLSRTVLRRREVEESFRVTLDASGLSVVSEARKGVAEASVPASELLAVHRSYGTQRRYTAITTSGLIEIPRHDQISARGATDATDWMFARVNQRLGL